MALSPGPCRQDLLSNDALSALFPAVIEATEEAIYNSLFRAETTSGNGRTVGIHYRNAEKPQDASPKLAEDGATEPRPSGSG